MKSYFYYSIFVCFLGFMGGGPIFFGGGFEDGSFKLSVKSKVLAGSSIWVLLVFLDRE